MPSIITASKPVTNFANGFASPYGSDQIIPLYSAVPLNLNQGNCLPCVACGNSVVRSNLIKYTSTTSALANTSLVTTSPTLPYTITFLLVGGGGAAGSSVADNGNTPGGGGAGGIVTSTIQVQIGQALNISVGGGGTNTYFTDISIRGKNGANSVINYLSNSIIAYGGGGGGGVDIGQTDGAVGGSGGGGGSPSNIIGQGGLNISDQGNLGARSRINPNNGAPVGGGGGGGAGGAGSLPTFSPDYNPNYYYGGNGGAGFTSLITGSLSYYAAGGGGAGPDANHFGSNGLGWPCYGSGGSGYDINFDRGLGNPGYDGVCILSIPTESYSGRYYGTLASGNPLTVGNSKVLVFTSTDATYIA